MKLLCGLLISGIFFVYNNGAEAACSSPTGSEGQMQWIAANSDVEFCDGTTWSSLLISTSGSACTTAGQIQYSAGDINFCDGAHWASMNSTSLGTSCSATGMMTYDATIPSLKWCDGTNWRLMGSTPRASATYITNSSNTTGLTTYTFSSLSLGSAYVDRAIVIGVAARASSIQTISSVTVGGVSTTPIYQNGGGTSSVAGFYIVAMPTGASGDVVVTFSGAMVRAGVVVWSVRHLQSLTATGTYALTGGSPTAAINVSAGGVALGLVYNTNNTSGVTWTGLNLDFSNQVSGVMTFSSSSAAFANAQTGLSVTPATTTWTTNAGAVISLR